MKTHHNIQYSDKKKWQIPAMQKKNVAWKKEILLYCYTRHQ